MGVSRMPMTGLPLPGRLPLTRARSHIPPFVLWESGHRPQKMALGRGSCDRSQGSGICVSCALSCFSFILVHHLGATWS